MKLQFSDAARLELRRARDHYNAERKGLGREFVLEMRALAKRVANAPQEFPVLEGTTSKRVLATRFPYMLVFAVEDKLVRILAVAHQHREPGYWFDRS